MKNKQTEDSDIGIIVPWLGGQNKNEIPASSMEARHYWTYWRCLEIHQGVVYKRAMNMDGTSHLQLIVPRSIRRTLFDKMHCSVFGGHLGTKKTISKIQEKHYWFNMREDVKLWIKQCDICARNKRLLKQPKALIGDMRTGAPMDRICMDIMGPLPESHRGNKYIQVITDGFTKWVELRAIPDQTAETCASHLVDAVISRFGCPLTVHTDQGRNYTGNVIKELCRLLEIKKTRTSPRRPQCNGQPERFNKTMISMIKAFLKGEQKNWDLYLDCLAAAYRSSKHELTGYTPNFLMFGREIRLPTELVAPIPEGDSKTWPGYVESLRDKLHKAHEIVRMRMKRKMVHQTEKYGPLSHQFQYKEGDLVWYRNEIPKDGISPKLQDAYTGPCLVLSNYHHIDYVIQKNKRGNPVVVHHDKLKPYEGTSTLPWAKSALKQNRKKGLKV